MEPYRLIGMIGHTAVKCCLNCGALVSGDETVTHTEWHERMATAAADGRHGRAAYEEMRRLQVGRLEEDPDGGRRGD